MHRRDLLVGAGGIATNLLLGGCTWGAWKLDSSNSNQASVNTPILSGLIDVHTHIFNGSDLPTVRFIKIVVLHHYPRQAVRVLDIQDADALDALLAVLTWIVGRTKAPTAADEIMVLDRQAKAVPRNFNIPVNESAVIDAIAEVVSQDEIPTGPNISSAGLISVRKAILEAAGEKGLAVSGTRLGQPEANQVAEKAFRSQFDMGLVLRWFALFTRYRHVLAEQLANDHNRQGFQPLLLCPASIDYDCWLGENVDASPLPQQVAVMGRLARRSVGPVVHGYVAYDPLRQALFEARRFTRYNPLELVRHALRDEGFVGVKLYPPMGFKPYGNQEDVCQTYPDNANFQHFLLPEAADNPETMKCKPRPLNGSRIIGQKLDKAMTDLFDVCVAEEGCILAHANNSNEVAEGYGKRADPAYWIPVFQRWPKLRVALAHFGSFNNRSTTMPADTQLPEASWEWTLGRYLKEKPDSLVFADVSYLTEFFYLPPREAKIYSETFKHWIDQFDPQCHHLMFGTDWVMLGLSPTYETYTSRVHDFFKKTIGLDNERLDRLFVGNAAQFLGLRQGDGARNRLMQFYDRHNLPKARLPMFLATRSESLRNVL